MSPMRSIGAAFIACLALAACDDELAHSEWRLPDVVTFAQQAQPVLAARCATPSCHGRADRPLAIYAPGLHRRDARDLHRDLPLDEAELRSNLLRVLAFVARDGDRSELLTKPLAPAAGGVAHEGGVQFADTSDWDFRALRAWVDGLATAPDPGGAP